MKLQIILFTLAISSLIFWLLHRRIRRQPPPIRRQIRRRLALAGGLALGGVYAGLVWTSVDLITEPPREPVNGTPASVGLEYEEVTLTSADGVRLAGWYIPPQNDATIILLHGGHVNRAYMLRHAELLATHGYGLMLIDFRNHGDSGDSFTTLGYNEVEDVRAALDYVLARPETNPDRIGVLGRSMGGATAIRAAAQMPEIDALVTESTYTSLDAIVDGGVQYATGLPALLFTPVIVWLAEQKTGAEMGQLRPIDDIAAIHPRPVLLVHGDQDPLVPIQQAEMLYNAAGSPKELERLTDVGHTGLIWRAPEQFARSVLGFFDRWLLEAK